MALTLSGFFLLPYRSIPLLFLVFILPWAMPAIPTFISAHWLLNGQWGLINSFIWTYFGTDGPGWLTDPELAMASVIVFYIWKWLPFWTVIFVAGRTAIPSELYEAARIDGARGTQLFRFVTFPMLRSLYLICTVLSTIWSLGTTTRSTSSPAAGLRSRRTSWPPSASATPSTSVSRRSAWRP